MKRGLSAFLCLLCIPAYAQTPETVHSFYGPMPTGITVSHTGRIFVCYPRWGDPVPFTVAEIKNGHEVPYPDAAINREDRKRPGQSLICVQSVVIDSKDRLWILDPAAPKLGPNLPGGPKIVGVDLRTDRVFKTILIPPDVAYQSTYLNDIRFDLRRGKAGYAFITDSANTGPNGIIVVDLASGKSFRRLNNHPSTKAVPNFVPLVEGQPLMTRRPGNTPKPIKMGSDGITISSDGKTLYYCPLASRHLYSVSVDALVDRKMSDEQVGETVKDVGVKGASDGLESDAEGRLYATDYEHHRILVGPPGGPYKTLTVARPYDWPDTMFVAHDGYLYFTANELQRQGIYHYGKDLRKKPYKLYRISISGHHPALLK